jgi:hypothetical protein
MEMFILIWGGPRQYYVNDRAQVSATTPMNPLETVLPVVESTGFVLEASRSYKL